jgi:hypothetical protein
MTTEMDEGQAEIVISDKGRKWFSERRHKNKVTTPVITRKFTTESAQTFPKRPSQWRSTLLTRMATRRESPSISPEAILLCFSHASRLAMQELR